MKGQSPLLGYNTNVRHRGKLYHIQSEDSGVKHPHIITHLFADGGRVISSKKTSYAEHVGQEDCKQIVKKLMQEQHKAMFIALRDGEFDEEPPSGEQKSGEQPLTPSSAGDEPAPRPPEPPVPPSAPRAPVDVDALDRAAARLSNPSSGSQRPPSSRPAGAGVYQTTRPATGVDRVRSDTPPAESIFGKDLLSEKSLDEVILSYLAEDLEEAD